MKQIPLPLPHHEAMGADDFLVTSSNRDAAAWIGKWPDWPAHGLIISGSSGSGKTHLINLWLGQSNGRFVTLPELLGHDASSLTSSTKHIAIDNADSVGVMRQPKKNYSIFIIILKRRKVRCC